jgi:hypothetical protein
VKKPPVKVAVLRLLVTLSALAWAGAAMAATRQAGESPLAPALIVLAAAAAVVIAGVAVWRLYRSSFGGKPKFPPRDGDQT